MHQMTLRLDDAVEHPRPSLKEHRRLALSLSIDLGCPHVVDVVVRDGDRAVLEAELDASALRAWMLAVAEVVAENRRDA